MQSITLSAFIAILITVVQAQLQAGIHKDDHKRNGSILYSNELDISVPIPVLPIPGLSGLGTVNNWNGQLPGLPLPQQWPSQRLEWSRH
ncbi:hypothetical protein OSTOST_13355, partial [Ostertagia ostertagi]